MRITADRKPQRPRQVRRRVQQRCHLAELWSCSRADCHVRCLKLGVFAIRSFGDKRTEALFRDERVRQFEGIARAAKRKLEALNAASRLDDLAKPPSNRARQISSEAGLLGMWPNALHRVVHSAARSATSSRCCSVAATIANCTAAATKPRSGRRLGSIRAARLARYGSKRIRCPWLRTT
jgi:plasmid maintenance system killer protein